MQPGRVGACGLVSWSIQGMRVSSQDGNGPGGCSIVNVLVDGHALSIRSGTGLARHAVETMGANATQSHHQDLLLGTPIQRVAPRYVTSAVLQGTWLSKRVPRHQFTRSGLLAFASETAFHSSASLHPRLSTIRQLDFHDDRYHVDLPFDPRHVRHAYNSSGLFRTAVSWAALTRMPLETHWPRSFVRPDVFHVTTPLPVRIRGIPTVMTVHDLIPLSAPQMTRSPLRWYSHVLDASLRTAHVLAVVSEHTAGELRAFYPTLRKRTVVTYQAVDLEPHRHALSDEAVDTITRAHGLERGHYLLFTGAVEPKKNLDRLLAAYAATRITCPLVILGPSGWMNKETERQIERMRTRGVVRLSYLRRDVQLALVKGARLLVFPSLAEGFGLPVLEAMALGTPVVTSTHPAIMEITGGAAIHVPAKANHELAAALTRVHEAPSLREEMALQGMERASFFTPSRYAERLNEAYNVALGAT